MVSAQIKPSDCRKANRGIHKTIPLMTPPSPQLPRLYLVSSGYNSVDSYTQLEKQVACFSSSCPCIVQIREKMLDAKTLFDLSCSIAQSIISAGSMVIINERVDIALAAALNGVHFPENSCPPERFREMTRGKILGQSTHSIKTACLSQQAGVDYILFGPVFDTPSKRSFGPPQGLLNLAAVCEATSLPVFAIGGVTPQNASSCLDAGAYGVAALSLFLDTTRLVTTLDKFHRLLYS